MTAWGSGQTTPRQARWIILISLVIILATWRAYGQESKTTVDLSDGSQKTVECQHTPGSSLASCSIYDTTPTLWSVLKENRERGRWCHAQHLSTKRPDSGFGKTGVQPSPCETAWVDHVAAASQEVK